MWIHRWDHQNHCNQYQTCVIEHLLNNNLISARILGATSALPFALNPLLSASGWPNNMLRSLHNNFPPFSHHLLSNSGFYAPQYELLDPRTGRSVSQGFKIIRYWNAEIIGYCVPWSAPGFRNGNGEKLSRTQAEPGQAIKSAVP